MYTNKMSRKRETYVPMRSSVHEVKSGWPNRGEQVGRAAVICESKASRVREKIGWKVGGVIIG